MYPLLSVQFVQFHMSYSTPPCTIRLGNTDTSTHSVLDTWIRIRYGYTLDTYPRSIWKKINADKLDTFYDTYWATMAHQRIRLGPATTHLKGY
jgi:hypothetical protein